MASRIIDVDYYAGGDRKVVTSVDVYKSIRALQLEGVTSQRAAAKILGISRNTVKKYWMGDAVPWDRKAYQREASVITPEVTSHNYLVNVFILQIILVKEVGNRAVADCIRSPSDVKQVGNSVPHSKVEASIILDIQYFRSFGRQLPNIIGGSSLQ